MTDHQITLPFTVHEKQRTSVLSRLHFCSEALDGFELSEDGRQIRYGLRTDKPVDRTEIEGKILRLVGPFAQPPTKRPPDVVVDFMNRPVPGRDDPREKLLAEGELFDLGPGRCALGPKLTALKAGLKRYFEAMAAEFGASPYSFPELIATKTLQRCDYFRSFPHTITFAHSLRRDVDVIEHFGQRSSATGNPTPHPDEFECAEHILAPAVCYNLYTCLRDRQLTRPVVATATGHCFREETGNFDGLARLWDFEMHEVVFAGTPDHAMSGRQRLLDRWCSEADKLGLACTIEEANDPFFVGEYRSRTLFQSAFRTKYELRCLLPYNGQTIAVSSFNYHQKFFGESFGISTPDGLPAHTACVGHGLERWVLAIVAQFGCEPSGWPEPIRRHCRSGL